MAAVPLAPVISHSTAPAPVIHHENRKNLTFVQSLPILSELGEDPGFVSAIKKMKDDQNRLERRLWEDREAIYAKYQDKIKVTQTKAQMIGTPVSQHEINMIMDAFNKEIFRFDRERILPAWDGLVSRQQNELGQMTVPTMFVTTDVQDRKVTSINCYFLSNGFTTFLFKKQQQVISVLETITGPNIA
ncbi:hypothetical protein BDN70DRAFT_485230 [Pholiota conissans]|uniref:Uncharacterized protein n=1 Tax=Pholiota conissans TaxID=109636 RepID=A0A9P5Z889_9AGAR|nr:hypothetical protein BDN70DRAFT_485230 [Pholiota conissans]